MPAPANNDELLDLVRKSGVLDDKRLDGYLARMAGPNAIPPEPSKFAGLMVRDGLLTHFQAEQFLQGKWRRFTIGRYKVLERLGAGGMGSVYLCEHKLMRRRVAVKVLPTAKADDPASLERFYREARAVAALDHPNIVRAYDIDQDEKLHFLVMEFVDGANFQEIIKRTGPMDVLRAAHYIRQAALGIQHAHETAGLVHRDIKPGNILVDRNGIVKILDMGLARFFHDQDDILTKKYDENVLGTADYLAPEQALDSHAVDIRADIYSLGATFYFILTGRPPFAEGTVAQKLIWHQTRQPKPVRSIRADVPEELAAVLDKAMAKDPGGRYQTPNEMAEALAPWTKTPIPPPPEEEMPQLSPAALSDPSLRPPSTDPPSGLRKQWQVANGQPSTPTAVPRPASSAAAPPVAPSAAPAVAPSAAPAVAPSAASASIRKSGQMPTAASAPAPARPSVAAVQAASKAPVRPALAHVPLRPAPAPARQAAAPVAPDEEEAASWDKLVTDTEDPAAELDTAPRSGARPAPKPGPARKGSGLHALPLSPASKRRLWIIIAASAALVVVLIAIGVWIAITFATGSTPKHPGLHEPLRVDPGDAKAYKTIQAAVDRAGSGDRIILAGDVEEGEVRVRNKENLVIESEHRVTWKYAAGTDTARQMLRVESSPGFQLRGVNLDGAGRADFLVTLFGSCPDLKLSDLELRGFKQSDGRPSAAVNVTNCDGTIGHPIELSDLRITTSDPAQAGVSFTFIQASIQKTQYFTITNSYCAGPGHKAMTTAPDAVKDVKLPDMWSMDPAPPKPPPPVPPVPPGQ
jgi:serine/threonine protein kinase